MRPAGRLWRTSASSCSPLAAHIPLLGEHQPRRLSGREPLLIDATESTAGALLDLAPSLAERLGRPRLAMPVNPEEMHPAVPPGCMLSPTSRHRATPVRFGSPLRRSQTLEDVPHRLTGDPYLPPDLLERCPLLPSSQDIRIAFGIARAHHIQESSLPLSLTRFSIARYACQGYRRGGRSPPRPQKRPERKGSAARPGLARHRRPPHA